MSQGRAVWAQIYRNFVKSFRLTKKEHRCGVYQGDDYHGNKYFEIPADPQRGKRHPSRYFEPGDKEKSFEAEMTPEWEAWMRHRRVDPPTEEELKRNLAAMFMKKKNAGELAEKEGPSTPIDKLENVHSYPVYEDYEVTPGSVASKEAQKKIT